MKRVVNARIVCFLCKKGDKTLYRISNEDYACAIHKDQKPAIGNQSRIYE